MIYYAYSHVYAHADGAHQTNYFVLVNGYAGGTHAAPRTVHYNSVDVDIEDRPYYSSDGHLSHNYDSDEYSDPTEELPSRKIASK